MYPTINDLPKGIRGSLPKEAQNLYLREFNSVWRKFTDGMLEKKGLSREKTAHCLAWSAIKQEYEQAGDGIWRLKQKTA